MGKFSFVTCPSLLCSSLFFLNLPVKKKVTSARDRTDAKAEVAPSLAYKLIILQRKEKYNGQKSWKFLVKKKI